jgi:hypothetical protein
MALVIMGALVSCAKDETNSDNDAVRAFVQSFYDWYVPTSRQVSADRPSALVLRERPSAFDPNLAGELKEDSDAQAKAPGDIVGLDFDPFLAAQDPCERYEVLDVRKDAQNYRVSVRGRGGCETHEEPDVDAEIISRDGTWLFTNFHYPRSGGTDLLTTLKKLRDDRKQLR